ncbi:hypothetical protein H8356DRAFT_1678723 [Neocallimastix lanati (nom. inval.)]|jgi:hypothetical protein|nr:hypothetical protein H8356DRAFT_1678723 [Neocallimastix sp. JGI-2020a]
MPGKQIYIDSTASPRLVQKYKLLKKRIKESQDLRNLNKINPTSLSQNKITLKINLGAVKEQLTGCPSPALSYNSSNLSDDYIKRNDYESDNSESSLSSYQSDSNNSPVRGRSIERSLLFFKNQQQQSRSLSSDSSSSVNSDISISTLGSLDSDSQESTSSIYAKDSLLPSPNSTPLPKEINEHDINEINENNKEEIYLSDSDDGSISPQYEIVVDDKEEIEIDSEIEDFGEFPETFTELDSEEELILTDSEEEQEEPKPNKNVQIEEKIIKEDKNVKPSLIPESSQENIVKVIKGETKRMERLPPIEKRINKENKRSNEEVMNMKKRENSYIRPSRSRSRSRSRSPYSSHRNRSRSPYSSNRNKSRSRSPHYRSEFRTSYKSYNRSRSRSRNRSRSRSRSRSRHTRYRDDDYYYSSRHDRDRNYRSRKSHYYNHRKQRHFEEEADDDDEEIVSTTNTIEKTIMEDPRKKPILDIEQTQIYRESASYLETEFYKKTIYIGDLEEDTPESVLRQNFSRFGEIKEIKVFPGKQYAFISYKSSNSALEAIKRMNGYKLGLSVIKVGKAKIPERNKYGFGNRPWQDDDGAMAITQDTYGSEYINNDLNQSSSMANFSAYNIYGHRNVNIINPKNYQNSNIGILDPRASKRTLLSYDDF